MNPITLALSLTDIKEEYINEAETWSPHVKHHIISQWLKIAIIFICIGIAGVVLTMLIPARNEIYPLSVSAKELGLEEYPLDIGLPHVIYGDDDKIVMYDSRGVFVYDISQQKLVGFADFIPIDMTQIQGDEPTFVEITTNGEYVKIYNKERRFLYDVSTNKMDEVENYAEIDQSFERYDIITLLIDDSRSLTPRYTTYLGNNNSLIAVVLDYNFETGDGIIRYKDLRLIRKADDEITEYNIFQ